MILDRINDSLAVNRIAGRTLGTLAMRLRPFNAIVVAVLVIPSGLLPIDRIGRRLGGGD